VARQSASDANCSARRKAGYARHSQIVFRSDALLQSRIVEIGNTGLDGVIEPSQAQVGFGRRLV